MKPAEWPRVVAVLESLWTKSAQVELLNELDVSLEWSAQFAEFDVEHVIAGARRWAGVSEYPPRIAQLRECARRVRADEAAAKREREAPRPLRQMPPERVRRCAAAARIVYAAIRMGTCEPTEAAAVRLFFTVLETSDLFEYHDAMIRELAQFKPDARGFLEFLTAVERSAA